jgi:hypothetical protein
MTTTVSLIRAAESQGAIIFWSDGNYHFAPENCEHFPARWSEPFADLDECAYAAISAGLAPLAPEGFAYVQF